MFRVSKGSLIAKAILLLICIASLLFACMTPHKAVSYLKKRNLLADTCAANFPVKDSISVNERINIDTVYIDSPQPEGYLDFTGEDTAKVKPVPRPRTIVIRQTVTKDSIHYLRDIANETVLYKKLNEQVDTINKLKQTIEVKDAKIKEQEQTITNKNRMIFKLWILIVILIIIIFRRQIASLFSFVANIINPIKKFLPF